MGTIDEKTKEHINNIQHKLENLIDSGEIKKTKDVLDIFREFVEMRNEFITNHPRYVEGRDRLYTHHYLS